MSGESTHKLRGNYAQIRADYTVDQDYAAYSVAEHDLWKRLYARQSAEVPRYACDEFNAVLATLNFGSGIPKFSEINAKLFAATRWQLVAVPGLVPDDVFFTHLANRRFPV
jgi:phenylalanine-4-hydroxylase